MNPEELIIKYFNNTLSKEEEIQFTSLLDTDDDFKTLFEEHKDMQMAFKINEKDELKGLLNTIDAPKKSILKILFNKTSALAAACCLVFGVFYFANNSSSSTIYETYFEEYPNVLEPVTRGKTTSNSEAFAAYENKYYLEAEKQFKEILNTAPNNNIEFYYAMSLLNQHKTQKAEKVLSELKLKECDFKAEVFWYKALIAVKNKNFETAKKEIKSMNILNTEFKKEERIKLLQLID